MQYQSLPLKGGNIFWLYRKLLAIWYKKALCFQGFRINQGVT